ncbi:MAG TPA: anti-sigma factor, partial [Clostridiaceae bacterium]|nr:anti-sigma factor [Clostridiaceae bacterium]
MSKSDMERLKEEYMNIEIPKELDFMVRKAIKGGLRKNYKKNIYK